MRKTIISILCFFSLLFSFSQQTKTEFDEVFNNIKKEDNSIEKVEKLIDLYKNSVRKRISNEKIIAEALKISEEIFYINGIAKSYDRKGLTARFNNKYTKAIQLHKRALRYFEQTNDSLSKIKCLNNLGVAYRKINKTNEAFNYYFQALKTAESIKNNKSIAIANNGIGNIFVDTGQYDEAIKYLKKAIEITVEYNNDRNQEIGLSNIGEVYILKKQYDSAFYYINKSLDIAKKTKNTLGIAIKQNLLGVLTQTKGNYKQSIAYFDKAIPVLEKNKNNYYLSNSLINRGISNSKLGIYNSSKKDIDKGMLIARKRNSIDNITLAYKGLVNFYETQGEYKKALGVHKMATNFYDSILKSDSNKSINNYKLAYESFLKDEKIKRLAINQEKEQKKAKKRFTRMLFGLLFALLLILILTYVIFLNRKHKDLVLENKNNEIQNYLLQINELKNSNKKIKIDDNFSSKFENFNLSKREREIFNHIANGLTNLEIADKLFLSKNTIKKHIQNIYSKLDVKNRIQALKKIQS
jgi:ATP/maltotriose-dependent transcriptional regulator MalT